MTLNNLVSRIWLRLIELLYKLALHFLWKDELCRLRHCKDGLNLCPPSKVSRHLRLIFSNNIFVSPIFKR